MTLTGLKVRQFVHGNLKIMLIRLNLRPLTWTKLPQLW